MQFPPSFEFNDSPAGTIPVGGAVLDSHSGNGRRDSRVRLIVLSNDPSTSVREFAKEIRRRLNLDLPLKVIIDVSEGVARVRNDQVFRHPTDVAVEIVDHDVPDEDDDLGESGA